MITDDKITEFFCATDEFSKKFDEELMNLIAALGAYCVFDNKPEAIQGYCIEDTKQLSLF